MGEETQVPAVDEKRLQKLTRAYVKATRGLLREDKVRLRAQFNWALDGEEGMETLMVTPRRMEDITQAVEWFEKVQQGSRSQRRRKARDA